MAPRPRHVVVVGASAGGVEALRAMAGGLPAGLEAAVLVVLHMPVDAHSALPDILSRLGPVPARMARHGEALEHGQIYTARPGHHLLVNDNAIALSPRVMGQRHRPSIDLLFRSAAADRGDSVVGVLLSGTLYDGVDGLVAIAGVGGRAVVQDPEDAIFPGMPSRALRALTPDHVAPAGLIGRVLAEWTRSAAATAGQSSD